MSRSIVLTSAMIALTAGAAAAPSPRLEIHDFQFTPREITVVPGTTVRWVNDDEETHTVTSSTGRFGSPALDHGEAFTHTFTQAGTYTYYCALHPLMKATVVVKGD